MVHRHVSVRAMSGQPAVVTCSARRWRKGNRSAVAARHAKLGGRAAFFRLNYDEIENQSVSDCISRK